VTGAQPDPAPFPTVEPGPDGGFGEALVPAGPARPARRRLLWIAGALLVPVLILAAVFGPSTWQMLQEKDATLATPAEAAGLTLDTSEQARGTADYLRTALAAQLGLGHPVGAVYADGSAPSRSVILIGGTGRLRSPENDLDDAFRLLADASTTVHGAHTLSPGDMGGVMKCATASSQDGDVPVCGWADHGSLAVAMFPGRSVEESAELLRSLRRAILHRA
jgi:hypothetical protein